MISKTVEQINSERNRHQQQFKKLEKAEVHMTAHRRQHITFSFTCNYQQLQLHINN